MTRSAASRRRRGVGIAMMVSSLGVTASLISLAPAGAQSESEPEIVTLEVIKSAYYTTSPGRGAPNTVTSEFPPGVVCVVKPEFCPEAAEPVTKPIGDALGGIEDLPTGPASPTLSGTLPVGIQFGEPYYRSALLTSLPDVPAGQVVDKFVLRLAEDPAQTFHASSPMFRQAVLFALTTYQKQGFDQEEFEKVLAANPANTAVTGVEACPVTTDFAAGEHLPETDAPEVECLYGSNGVRLDDGTWEFDLSFAVEAWTDGSLPNLGIMLRPSAAPNLAYGDKDLTSSARVVFLPETTEAAITRAPEPEPYTPPSSSTSSPSSPSYTAPGFSGGSGTGGMQPAPIFAPETPAQPAPDVAPAPDPAFEDVAAPMVPTVPTSAWWVWLLVPVFLAGMYLTAQSLTAEVVLASERRGAMSRLLAINEAAPEAAPSGGALTRLVSRN